LRCEECGTDNATGAENCEECGKILAVPLVRSTGGSEIFANLQSGASSGILGYGSMGTACCLCSDSCPSDELQKVRGAVFCPDCARLVRAGSNEADEAATGASPAPGPAAAVAPMAEPTIAPNAAEAEEDPFAGFRLAGGNPSDPSLPAPVDPTLPDTGPSSTGPHRSPPAYVPSYAPDPAGPAMAGPPSRRPIQPVSSRRSFPWPVLVLLLVLGAGGYLLWFFVLGRDRIDKLLAEAESSDRAVRLLPQYERGQTFRYRGDVKLRMDMSGSVPGQGSVSGSAEGDVGLDFYLDVLAVDAAGTTDLQLALEDIDVRLDLDVDGLDGLPGNINPQELEQLKGETVQFKIDRRGRPVAMPDEGTGFDMVAGLLGVSEEWPEREVRPGDTWTQTLDMPGATGDLDMVLTYHHVGYAKHLGRQCAVIEMKGDSEMTEGGGHLGVTVKGALFIDADEGALVDMAVDAEMQMTFSGFGANVNMEMDLSFDLKLQ
jgi:hypothetical protein